MHGRQSYVPFNMRQNMTATSPVTSLVNTVDPDEIDLGQLMSVLIAGKWFIALFALIGLGIGLAYITLATPIYSVNALVQVEENNSAGMNSIDGLEGLFEGKSSTITEIEIMRSRMVLGRSVSELDLSLQIAPKRWAIASYVVGQLDTFGLLSVEQASQLPVIGRFMQPDTVLDLARLSVPERWLGESLTLVRATGAGFSVYDPSDNLIGYGTIGEPFDVSGVSLFVRDVRAEVGQAFYIKRSRQLDSINRLNTHLKITEKGKQSGIIELVYEDPDPVRAARVANSVARNYVRQNVERKSAEAEQTLAFLDEQLPVLKKQLEAAEVRFNDYRSRKGILDMTADGQRLLEQSVAAEAGLFELQQKRKELMSRLTPEHPSVQALDRQIVGVQAQRGKFSGQVSRLPKEQQELLRLTRDLQVNQALYTQLLNSAQQLKVAKAGTVGNVRILDEALATSEPVRPKRSLVVVLALLLGFFLGLGLVLLRHALKRGVKDANQIEQHLGLSVLATVPTSAEQIKLSDKLRSKGKQSLVLAQEQPNDIAIEALRSLRTGLHFALIDTPNNRLMVTGPSPSVGKSFVSLNLAAVMASAGQRVVVIDADMRRGHINEYFGHSRVDGLSDFIAGDKGIDTIVRPSGQPGLYYVTTGRIPPNPSELLLHPRFAELLANLSEQFDQVIVDSPPVLAVTDAAIIGRHMGASLLMARFGQTPLRELELAMKRLQQAGVPLNGVVMNGVEVSQGYGYGSEYSYAYQYSSTAK